MGRVIALSEWVVGSSAPVPVVGGATSVEYAAAPALSPYLGVGPVVGAPGRLAEVTVEWAADGVYSIGFDLDSPVVSDVVADSLPTLVAVLDDRAAKIAIAYPTLGVQRVSLPPPSSPAERILVWSADEQPSIQASATGTGAQIGVLATTGTGTTTAVVVAGIDAAGIVRPIAAGSTGIPGGEVAMRPGVARVLIPAIGEVSTDDTGVDPMGLIWLRYLRRS
jgi:hypothetical protein